MKSLKQLWKASWRVGLCLFLLAWILHSIFLHEGKMACAQQGIKWDQLSGGAQWHKAWTIGPQELWHTLCQAHPAALGLAIALVWVIVILGVARWRMVLAVQGLNLPLNRTVSISLIAQFFSAFMLGSAGGDLIKAYYVARETHHKKTEAVVTVFVDRVIGLWAMLLFAGLMMFPNAQLLLRHRRLDVVVVLILGMLAASTVLLILAFWGGVSRRFPRARAWLRSMPKGELLERSLDSCRQFGRHWPFLLKATGLSLFVNLVVVLQWVVLAAGLHLTIPPTALLLIVPAVVCISALPITPGGIGVRENLVVLMLAPMGVSATSALSLSLLAYATALFWSLVGGLVYLSLKDREHLAEVTHETATPVGNA